MSENVADDAVAADPKKAVAKKAVKKVVKKTAAKVTKSTKAPAKKKAAGGGDPERKFVGTVVERSNAILKALRKAGATNAAHALTVAELMEKTGMNRFNVYETLYVKRRIQVEEFVKQVASEGGNAYHLTAKGQKTDME